MRKILSLLLATLFILGLVACNPVDNSGPSSDHMQQNDPSTPLQTETTPLTNPTEGENATGSENEPRPSGTVKLPDFKKDATIEQTVLFNEQDITITATELTYGSYSAELALTIENNSAVDISVVSGSTGYCCNSINGYMVTEGYMNCDVSAGKKAKETISFEYDSLRLYGIFEIADLEIGFDIQDDDYNHIYSGPCKISTSAAGSYNYHAPSYRETIISDAAINTFDYTLYHFTEDVLYNQDDFSVVSGGIVINESGEKLVLLEAVNSSDKSITARIEGAHINGLTVYSGRWDSSDINPHKTCVIAVNLSNMIDDSYWSTFGLENIGTVTVTLQLLDEDDNKLGDSIDLTISKPGISASYSSDGADLYNSEGLRVALKDIVEDDSDYSDDILIVLLVENSTDALITLEDVYDSFSLNGYMMDCIAQSVDIDAGSAAILDIELSEYDLEENSITSPNDIASFEITLELRDADWTYIDEITISYAVSDGASEETSGTQLGEVTAGIRPEFKEAMDAYETFYDEYCDFLKKYNENPSDIALLVQYTDMLLRAEEMNTAFSEWDDGTLSAEELQYYLEVNNRVMQKLLTVSE